MKEWRLENREWNRQWTAGCNEGRNRMGDGMKDDSILQTIASFHLPFYSVFLFHPAVHRLFYSPFSILSLYRVIFESMFLNSTICVREYFASTKSRKS